ncbi:DUF3168 domain-containing protein [Paracoccus ravus]|uniref:DUF3168 domain-containing protein n=1 Tax=Paracoccus ravus TaxID=2447760 RepID=UPI00106E9532|nr:DUF3168 domain-containing protein [Paracoccus ravus]
MSYAAAVALQSAVYQLLREDDALQHLVGDAIFDAQPVSGTVGPYVVLGNEDSRDAGDMTGAGSSHDFTVSVLSGAEGAQGFGQVKLAAEAISAALDQPAVTLSRGHLVGMWLLRARARRIEKGSGRRVDLTFRARIDLG